MLDSVRKNMKTKNVIGWTLLILVCGVFVFLGLPQQFGVPGGGSAATVNGKLISVADLQSEEQRLGQVFANFMGGQGDIGAQRQFLRQQAIQNLVTMELVAQAASEQGIRISDAEIRNLLVNEIPAFQEDGHFQRDRYRRYLQAIKSSPAEFEAKLRKDRQNLRVRRIIESAMEPLDIELAKQEALRTQQLNVDFVQLDAGELAKNLEIGQSAIEQALAQEEFKTKVSEYYDLNKEEFSEPEQVKAQHILVRIEDPSKEKEAQAKLKEVQKELETKDFSEVAKQYSDDPGSKKQGGDLGFFEKGRMTPEFEKVAFELEPGKVSEPVKTPFGYHLIKVNEKKPASEQTLDQAQADIAKRLIAEEKIDKDLEELNSLVQEGDASAIQAKLKELGAQWQETGFFNLTADRIPKLGSSPDLMKAVFGLQKQGETAKNLIRDGGKRYILKLKGQKAEKDEATASVLQEQISKDRSYAIYQAWVDAIRETASVEINPTVMASAQ